MWSFVTVEKYVFNGHDIAIKMACEPQVHFVNYALVVQ